MSVPEHYSRSAERGGAVISVRHAQPELVFSSGQRVAILVDGMYIHVGCHAITRDAWELLKKTVDELLK